MTVSLARCALVWLATTAVCAAVGTWAAGEVSDWSSFDTALPALAALSLIMCASWAWWVTTVVVVDAVRQRPFGPQRWARQLVLTACGVVLVGNIHVGPAEAVAAHVVADDQSAPGVGLGALEGLALPGRTTGPLVVGTGGSAPSSSARPATVTVRAGDSLWAIAERLLAPKASLGEVVDLMHRLHDLNLAEIGPEPDLIFPGHQLRTPLGERPAR